MRSKHTSQLPHPTLRASRTVSLPPKFNDSAGSRATPPAGALGASLHFGEMVGHDAKCCLLYVVNRLAEVRSPRFQREFASQQTMHVVCFNHNMFDVWAPEKQSAGGTVLRRPLLSGHRSDGTSPFHRARRTHLVEQLSAEVRSPRLQPEFSSQQTMNQICFNHNMVGRLLLTSR